jgi:hypothetical protein
MRRLGALLLAPLLGACTVLGMRTTEEPPFSVIERLGQAEIRRYGPRLLAEVEVEGDEQAARNQGFRPLAAYIFGENRSAERIGMTAPVVQQGGPQPAGERIGMTAPVVQQGVVQQGEAGRWRIGFLMPARYTRETLPLPRDARVTLRELPEETLAVLRFAGLPDEAAVRAAEARLAVALGASAWRVSGPGGTWFYDPPWTIPALRRSEVWRPVARD